MDGPDRKDLRTAFLGRFDEYEADLIVEILTGEGIVAFPKIARTDPNFTEYGPTISDLGVVLVDAARLDEAKRIVAEELPKQLDAIRHEMEAMRFDEDRNADGDDEEDLGPIVEEE